ncbi:MAG TPA: phosphodiester glycosidase family protein [Gemmatimonadales bacterium]|nr:phosphodiester glycosidase family protein [Gemmatimonadales bacterium]
MIGRATAGVIAVALFAAAAGPVGHEDTTLAVRLHSGASRLFWRASRAPVRWTEADATLSGLVSWHPGQPGVEWATLPIAGQGEAHALTLVLARIDPRAMSFDLVWGIERDRPAWTVDRAGDAALALNAGMFVERLPWGWVVMNGRERLPPGRGPLSSAIVGLADGRLAWVDGDDVSAWRGRAGGDVRFAFQSYPTLLAGDGEVPVAVRDGEIDGAHRDARLALGLDRQERLLVVLTRLDVPIPGADRLPFGLTVPEMAAVMGALGARHAMLLDGGISAQLAISDSAGHAKEWKGLRKVPLALVAGPVRGGGTHPDK